MDNPHFQETTQVLDSLITNLNPILVAWSGGKDSSAMLNLVLQTAKKVASRQFIIAPIVLSHANTGIENPEMSAYTQGEITKIRKFAKDNNLPITVEVAVPYLNSDWLVQVLSGRSLPSFPNSAESGRACSVDLKVRPQETLRKKIMVDLVNNTNPLLPATDPVTMLGTRFSESDSRGDKMRLRGESASNVWEAEKTGQRFISPIAEWDTDDVWEYLGMCKNGELESYSNFEETFRIYADSSSASCAVIADMETGQLKQSRGSCGARTGCYICTVTTDRSLLNMIKTDKERYGYMEGVNTLQQYLINSQYDWDKRSWVGRSIDSDGYLKIGPDTYSPQMLEDLFLMCLTLDVREQELFEAQKIDRPTFKLITTERLIAVDALWGMQGNHKAHHALYLYNKVYEEGVRMDVPKIKKVPRTSPPPPRYLYVGDSWNKDCTYSGLTNPINEVISEKDWGGGGCFKDKALKNGEVVTECNTDLMFSVNMESAYDLFDFDESKYWVANYHNHNTSPTVGYMNYINMGTVSIAKGKEHIANRILKRTNFKAENKLAGYNMDLDDILARSVSKSDKEKGVRVPQVPFKMKRYSQGELFKPHPYPKCA